MCVAVPAAVGRKSLSTFTVRRAVRGDYEAATVLLQAVDRLHVAEAPWLLQMPSTPAHSEASFANLVVAPDTAVFVAEAGAIVGLLVGLIKAAPEFPVFVPQRRGILDNLVVAESWRRRGVGAELVRAFESWATGEGAKFVELNVYVFNEDARRFYEHAGYVPMMTKLCKVP
jgi:GNAT superfamily N-acetyltransferase